MNGSTAATPVDRPGERIRSVRLDDERVCFDTGTGRLIVANEVGLAMWRGLADGHARARVVDDIARAFDAPRERMTADLDAFVADLAREERDRARHLDAFGPVIDPMPRRPFRLARRIRRRFPGAEVIVESESREVVARLERLLGHRLEDIVSSDPTSGHAGVVRVWTEGGRHPISFGEAVLDTGLHVDDAVTRLARTCAGAFAARDGWTAALHAAAIEREGRAIVLPAISGSGKTTLVAWLVGRGRGRLVNDDQVILRSGDLALPPAPYPLSVKRDSVPILEPSWPALSTLPLRRDRRGREIRELVLPDEATSDAPSRAVAIVVPNRRSGVSDAVSTGASGVVSTNARSNGEGRGEATLTTLPRAALLRSLVGNGLRLSPDVGWSEVLALTRWLNALPCLRLDYDDVEAAERRLEDVWTTVERETRPATTNRDGGEREC